MNIRSLFNFCEWWRQNTFGCFFLRQVITNTLILAVDDNFASHSAYFATRENNRLDGYVVKRFESPSFISCSQTCLRNAWCSSTKFKISSEKDGKGTCELNKHDSSLINENTDFYEEEGVTFSMLLKVGCMPFSEHRMILNNCRIVVGNVSGLDWHMSQNTLILFQRNLVSHSIANKTIK